MQRYKALSGDAGVTHFEIGPDSMTIQFKNRSLYLYTYASAGKRHIEGMKKLALAGDGLTTYINQNAKDRYAARLK